MDTPTATALPTVVTREQWLAARRELLAEEKALTRRHDALAARRRRLPMVRVETDYVFESADGPKRLIELFAGRRQLYVHHFMWNDEEQRHCPGCTQAANLVFASAPLREFLAERDVTFVAISRAPLAAIEAFRRERGWTFPWYSCAGNTFAYDFHAATDERVAPVLVNYRNKEEALAAGVDSWMFQSDLPANSVFLRDGDAVYHTYSAFQRGLDTLFTPWNFLDLTPYGRQEDWEDSPDGWPQRPTYA